MRELAVTGSKYLIFDQHEGMPDPVCEDVTVAGSSLSERIDVLAARLDTENQRREPPRLRDP